MAQLKYSGVGSRDTPENVLKIMELHGEIFASRGWLLRSGAAEGADQAFERGCDKVAGSKKEIFLPWYRFNNHTSKLNTVCDTARTMASKIHPAWENCSESARKMHGRNIYQVLGRNMDDPVDLIICWTKGGKEIGGTATAIRLAKFLGIDVLNLGELDL